MSLEPYQEYKNSGVEWLGKIPTSWSVVPLRHLALIETGTKDTVDSEPDGAYPFYVRSQTPLAIRTYTYDEEAILTPGDGDVGNIFHHVLGKFDVHQRVYVIRKFRNIVPRFLYYYFSNNFIKVVDYGGAKTTVASLRRPMFTTFPVALGSLKDQKSIADYLDRETSEIDAFIADQEQLITLLEERRTATITQAVTKGLYPDTPTKNSGLEWLSEIPEHWTVSRFSRCVRINSGQVDPKAPPFSEMYLIAPNHVESATGRLIKLETASSQGADSGKYLVRAGQVIYSKIRPNLMKTIVAPVDCLCSADMYGLEADRNQLSNKFLMYLLLSQPFHDYAVDQSMRVAMPKLNHDSLGAAPVWLPPQLEQVQIVKFLETELSEIDAAITDAREAIALSKERRAAVISAAVTGKIDVRGLVGPAASDLEGVSVGVA